MPEAMRRLVLDGVRRGISIVSERTASGCSSTIPDRRRRGRLRNARLHDIRRTPSSPSCVSGAARALQLAVRRGSPCSAPTAARRSARRRRSSERPPANAACRTGSSPPGDRLAAGAPLQLHSRRDAERLRHWRALGARGRRLRPRGPRPTWIPARGAIGAAQSERSVPAHELCSPPGQAGVVLQHARDGSASTAAGYGIRIPPVEDEVELIERYGVRVLGLALNGENLDAETLAGHAACCAASSELPVSLPLLDRGSRCSTPGRPDPEFHPAARTGARMRIEAVPRSGRAPAAHQAITPSPARRSPTSSSVSCASHAAGLSGAGCASPPANRGHGQSPETAARLSTPLASARRRRGFRDRPPGSPARARAPRHAAAPPATWALWDLLGGHLPASPSSTCSAAFTRRCRLR